MSFFAIDSALPNSQENRLSHGSYLKASGLYCSRPTLSHDTFRSASQHFFFREVKRWPESGRGHAEMKWNCSQISSTTVTSLLRCLRFQGLTLDQGEFIRLKTLCSCVLSKAAPLRNATFNLGCAASQPQWQLVHLQLPRDRATHGQFHFPCG